MSDEIDRAQAREAELLQDALARQSRRAAVAGCQLCVRCQGLFERFISKGNQ